MSVYWTSNHDFFFQLYNQRRPSSTRTRQDREGGPSRSPDTNGDSGGGGGDPAQIARPRGMSDALTRSSDPRQTGGGGVVRGGNVAAIAKDGRLPTSESIYG